MKKMILVFAIMISFVSFAQDRERNGKFESEKDVAIHLKRMTADIGLSDKQQSEVKVLLMDQFNKRKQAREEMKKEKENGAQISDEKRAEMKKNRIDDQLEMKTKLKKILTEEQMKKFEDLKKQRGKEKHEKGSREKNPADKEVK